MSLLTNWKLLLIGLVLLLLSCILSAIYINNLKNQNKAAIAEKNLLDAKLEVSNASITALKNVILEQRAAVEKMKQASEDRQRTNEAELKKALQDAKKSKDRAAQLIKLPRPKDTEVCTAADLMIDQEIENGKK